MSDEKSSPSQKMREKLLEAVLEDADYDGWNQASLDAAANRIGMSEGEVMMAAPKGITSLLEAWAGQADAHVAKTMATTDMSQMKIREKVAFGVRTRIEFLETHKEAARRAAHAVAAPWRADLGPKLLWSAADTIWAALGDKSTDFNWYTKRTMLSGVIASTLSTWLAEDDLDTVWAYLDDRIENVMQIEKAKAKMRAFTDKLPDPLDILKFVPKKPF